MDTLPAPDVLDVPPDPAGYEGGEDGAGPEAPIAQDGVQGIPDIHAGSVAPEPPEVDWVLAGEALAAVTGLSPRGPITREQGAEAEALLAAVGAAAQKFSKFRDFGKFKAKKRPDFEELWERIQPLTEEETAVATAGLADPELIAAWGEAVDRGRAIARAHWPVQVRDTPTGPEWIEPSRTEGGRATDVYSALNSPMEMLADLARGQLTPSQVEAAGAAYPELFPRIQEAYSAACKQQDGKRCPWSHEAQLRVLFNAPSQLVGFGPDDTTKKPGNAEIKIDFETLKTKGQSVR